MLQSTDQICEHQKIIEDHETQEGICTRCGTVVYNMERANLEQHKMAVKRPFTGWVSDTTSQISPLTKLGKKDYDGNMCTDQYYSRLRMLNSRAYPRKQ